MHRTAYGPHGVAEHSAYARAMVRRQVRSSRKGHSV